jgi:hypothetical protein
MITLFGGLAILWEKKNSIQPEHHAHQQNQGFNTQAGNDTILNVIGIIYVILKLNTFANFEGPSKIARRNFFLLLRA